MKQGQQERCSKIEREKDRMTTRRIREKETFRKMHTSLASSSETYTGGLVKPCITSQADILFSDFL